MDFLGENQEHRYALTKYTICHFFFGVFWGLLHNKIYKKKFIKESFALLLVLHIIFELLENHSFVKEMYKKFKIWRNYSGDTTMNSLFDIVFCMIGFCITVYLLQ